MSQKWKMPSPSETLAVIDEWRRLDLNSKSSEQVQREFERVFSKVLGVFQGETTTGGFSRYFRIRVRKFDSLIGRVDELWAPPPNKTKRGRCNFEKEPVLYVSTDGANCFEELNVKLGQKVYMIQYERRKGCGGLFLRSVYGADWDSMGVGDQIFETENDCVSYKILREFLRSEFMRPTCRKCDGSDFIHNVTASIAGVLRSRRNVDGFIYPSAVNVFSTNVALFPETAKQKLEIGKGWILKLVQKGASGVKYEVLSKALIDGESVSWVPCSGSGSFSRMTAEYSGK
jgi:hypothetical protein